MQSTAATVPPPRRRLRWDARYTAPVLITLILLAGHVSFGILESYEKTLLAIGAAFATEMVLGRVFRGKWPHLASAYISGISVGILIRSPLFWPYALTSMITITSKYVLRVKDRHIWNPSNFGICLVLFLAPATVAVLSIQWGNDLWSMVVIWVLGLVTVWRVGRLHISVTYAVSFVVFALVRSLITGNPFAAILAPITGPMYQLFIFFMLTDPKTTVGSRRGRIVVVVAIAFVEMLLRLAEVVYAPFYALFLVGPVALLIESWWRARVARR